MPAPLYSIADRKIVEDRFGEVKVEPYSQFNSWTTQGVPFYLRDARERKVWYVLAKCDCGTTTIVDLKNMVRGQSKDCGCGRIKTKTSHGRSRTPEYRAWIDMMNRCSNPDHEYFKHYGGRGITVCLRWYNPANFLNDIGPRPTSEHTLERVDNDLGYFPENCVWATRAEQSRNTRRTVNVTYNGKTMCILDWARELGINYRTLQNRLTTCGYSIEEAFNLPKHAGCGGKRCRS